MATPVKILGLAGSLRRASYNRAALRAARGLVPADATLETAGEPAMPRWPERDGRVKLSAAWLIERAGFRRGQTDGPVGLSTRHALAVVAHAGAAVRDVVRFAGRLRAGVESRFGVRLEPEPVFWGFGRLEDGLPVDPE